VVFADEVRWPLNGLRREFCVNGIAPGVFRTELNAGLLDGTGGAGRNFLLRTPMHRFGQLDELAGGSGVFWLRTRQVFVTGHVLVVDGGFLASGGESVEELKSDQGAYVLAKRGASSTPILASKFLSRTVRAPS